jgi:CheY-like chemotaxis protein
MGPILKGIFRRPNILVVEPDQVLRQMEGHALFLRYRIVLTGSAEEAVRTAAQHERNIDLLLTEVRLQRMAGWELAELLRLDYPNLKVVYLARSLDAQIRAHTLPSMVVLLENPFQPEPLRQAVHEVLKTGPNDRRPHRDLRVPKPLREGMVS